MDEPIRLGKAELRGRMREALRSLDPANRAEEGVALRRALLAWPAWVGARSVLGFLPLASEVDLRPLLAEALGRGVRVAVPEVTTEGVFRPCVLRSLEASALEPGAMGIPVPRVREAMPVESIDLVLVPGLAFDPQGRRLGRGGGFYDRSLPLCAPGTRLVAVVRDDEVLDALPAEPHDVRMTHALTPGSGLIALAGRPTST